MSDSDRIKGPAQTYGPSRIMGRAITTTEDHYQMICECQVCGHVWVRFKHQGIPRRCPAQPAGHTAWKDAMLRKPGFEPGSKPAKKTQARMIQVHAERGHTPRPERRQPTLRPKRPRGRPRKNAVSESVGQKG